MWNDDERSFQSSGSLLVEVIKSSDGSSKKQMENFSLASDLENDEILICGGVTDKTDSSDRLGWFNRDEEVYDEICSFHFPTRTWKLYDLKLQDCTVDCRTKYLKNERRRVFAKYSGAAYTYIYPPFEKDLKVYDFSTKEWTEYLTDETIPRLDQKCERFVTHQNTDYFIICGSHTETFWTEGRLKQTFHIIIYNIDTKESKVIDIPESTITKEEVCDVHSVTIMNDSVFVIKGPQDPRNSWDEDGNISKSKLDDVNSKCKILKLSGYLRSSKDYKDHIKWELFEDKPSHIIEDVISKNLKTWKDKTLLLYDDSWIKNDDDNNNTSEEEKDQNLMILYLCDIKTKIWRKFDVRHFSTSLHFSYPKSIVHGNSLIFVGDSSDIVLRIDLSICLEDENEKEDLMERISFLRQWIQEDENCKKINVIVCELKISFIKMLF